MYQNSNLILVTGATGWLGSRLVESLVRGMPEHDALKQPRVDLRLRRFAADGQPLLLHPQPVAQLLHVHARNLQQNARCAQARYAAGK